MFIVGVSVPTYTEQQLKELNDKAKETFSYKGKNYNEYEATQYQRQIETAMRASKRAILGYKESGLDAEFKQASILLQQQRREYKQFSQASGISQKLDRTQVNGFGRSVSQQATNSAKKGIAEQIAKENIKNVKDEIALDTVKTTKLTTLTSELKELNVAKYTDRKEMGRDILNTLDISKDIPINVKTMKDNGYCVIDFRNNGSKLLEYNLKENDNRNNIYKIKTALHEAYHAKGCGGASDFKLIEKEWAMVEETFAESSSHYMIKQLGLKEEISPSYAEKLVNMLPRLKQLDKYKDCEHIADFGKIAWEDRLEGVPSVWANLYDECYKIKHNVGKYSMQYHDYITNNMDNLINKMLENMPEYKNYKEQMINECKSALKTINENNGSMLKLNSNEEMVFSNVLILAMNRIGVK